MKSKLFIVGILMLFVFSVKSQNTGFEWVKNLVSNEDIYPYSIASDSEGNIFIAGTFEGQTDFNYGGDSYILTPEGYSATFIIKINPAGELIWVKNIGGSGHARAKSLALDNNYNIYITGSYSNTVDFDPNEGVYELESNGAQDIYVAKYDSSGSFIWAVSMGSEEFADDQGTSITVDNNENILVTGWFQDIVDFDPGEGVFNLSYSNRLACFVLKLTDEGNFIWAKKFDSTQGWVEGHTIKSDNEGNVYISGLFQASTDFNPGTGTNNLTPIEDNAAFLVKLNSSGEFVWAKQPGSYAYNNNLDKKRPFSIDNDGNIILAFDFEDTIDFDPGESEISLTSNGWKDIFIQKLNPQGNLLWVKQIGGEEDNDELGGLFVDESGNIYITGYITGTVDFDPSNETFNLSAREDWDIALFVAKYSSDGSLIWAHPINWLEDDSSWPFGKGIDLTVDNSGNVITTGQYWGSFNFNPNGTTANLTSYPDTYSGFILKLDGIATSNKTLKINNEFEVYPNPFNNSFVIFGSKGLMNASINLYTITGQIKASYQNISGKNFKINTEKITPGFYFLEISQEGRKIVTNLVKQ